MGVLPVPSGLLWTAADMFTYPADDNLIQLQTGLEQLVDWARARDRGQAGPDFVADTPLPLDLTQLQIDHTALFVNAFPVTRAHPFAGWYEGDSIIMGASDSKMRQFYARCGMEFDGRQLPADHIMVELEFLALMAERYQATHESFCCQAMGEMMHLHMGHWVHRFLENMHRHARTGFYRRLAAALSILFEELTIQLKEVA